MLPIDKSSADALPAARIAADLNDALAANSCVVVTAPPGAGKSTLLPLTILDGLGAGRILMLEPRRLAARQIAERMASLIGEPVGGTVGYRMRFESKVSRETRIEVVTEGILTRMLVDDPTLEGVDMVIFDEFHERSLQSDLAFALTREAQSLVRPDLRIVIMSATIDSDDICHRLAAVQIRCEGRMFPVQTVYCNRAEVTPEAVAGVISQAHREQDGDILAFLPGEAEIRRCAELLEPAGFEGTKIRPLYGMLPQQEQRAAIAPSVPGERKIVLATPIAETSLTIEGVRVVVDSGLCRKLVFDPRNGLSHLETVRISRDMAEQRRGRAGRVAPGVCYRVWNPATERQMAESRTPEILEADLSDAVLNVAAWGGGDFSDLPWLTMPPAVKVRDARQLLGELGALDNGHITAQGRRMAALPCHPRMARMLLDAAGNVGTVGRTGPGGPAGSVGSTGPSGSFGFAASVGFTGPSGSVGSAASVGSTGPSGSFGSVRLAAEIAALLEEKDPLGVDDADITLRLAQLHRETGRKNGSGRLDFHGRWGRIVRIADQYCRLVPRGGRMPGASPEMVPDGPVDPFAVGRLIAAAYPERVARVTGNGHFRLADGTNAYLSESEALAGCDWIAVASMNARPDGSAGKIFLAAPVDPEDLPLSERDNVSWDFRRGEIVAQHEWRIGGLIVRTVPIHTVAQEQIVRVICGAVAKEGRSLLDFNDEVQNLQRRIRTVADWHPEAELPVVDTDTVLQRAPEWLPMYLGKAKTTAELKKIRLVDAIWGLLSYEQQGLVDRMAPEAVTVPTGSRIRLQYRQGAEAPVLRVRLQECFGMARTPRVDGGRVPVLMELLSPGFKPVQLTTDLESFWSGTYFEVRKELRRRYPKHSWPDDPTAASPVRGVGKKIT